MDDDRPERAAAIEYLRERGTNAAAARLAAGLRATFRKFERTIDDVPEALRSLRPAPAAWSAHEIVDHLVESDRPAVGELRDLCEGRSSTGAPIAARLTSREPFARPWSALVDELKTLHAELLAIVDGAGDDTPLDATAASVIVVKVAGANPPEVLEWVQRLDWKAYTQALRVHTHEHCAQVERTVAALLARS